MGKLKLSRRSFGQNQSKKPQKKQYETLKMEDNSLKAPKTPLLKNKDPFGSLNIDYEALAKSTDDTHSVESSKSDSAIVNISKKDKLRLRREIFLEKLSITRTKKAKKATKKEKEQAMFDTNLLQDALPSLESLVKVEGAKIPNKQNDSTARKRGIEKTNKRKKNQLQSINIYHQIFKNKEFVKDPFGSISIHIANIVKSSD